MKVELVHCYVILVDCIMYTFVVYYESRKRKVTTRPTIYEYMSVGVFVSVGVILCCWVPSMDD